MSIVLQKKYFGKMAPVKVKRKKMHIKQKWSARLKCYNKVVTKVANKIY